MSATACHDCGAEDALPVIEDIYCEEGVFATLYLCRGCADLREGVPTMEEQCLEGDGEGRR